MGEDGSVVIGVDLNVKEAEKELSRLTKKVLQLEEEVGKAGAHKNALEAQWKEAQKALEDYRKENSMIPDGASTPFFFGDPAKLAELTENASKLQKEMEKYDEQIKQGNIDLEYTKQRWVAIEQAQAQARIEASRKAEEEARSIAGAIEEEARAAGEAVRQQQQLKEKTAESASSMREAADGASEMANATRRADGFMDKFTKRIVGLAKRVFVFTLITKALRSMRDWLGKTVKTNSEATASMARLKGALLTLAQPLVDVVIPAFTMLINVLTAVVGAIAEIVSMLAGTTVSAASESAKALYDEQQALEGVAAASDKASGSLAGFDEINKLSSGDADKGSAGAGAQEIAPDFSWMDGVTERLSSIADLVALIGAGFVLWKIGEMLPSGLGQISTLLGGILMTVGGLVLGWNGLADAWENGVDWANLLEMIGGFGAAVFGLYQIFGSTGAGIGLLAAGVSAFILGIKDAWENGVNWENMIATVAGLTAAIAGLYILFGPVAAGIGAVVGGIAMLVLAFADAMKSGWNLQNTLLAIAGIVATGLGFAFITGSVIPLLVAGIAALLLAFTVATGHGEELLDGIRTMLQGFVEFFKGIFTGDIEMAIGGIVKIFAGLKMAVGAVIDGIRDAIFSFLDWLDEKTGGKLHGIIWLIKSLLTDTFTTVKNFISGIIDSITQILSGFVKFIAGVFTLDFEAAWNGIKDIFKGILNGVISIFEGFVNFIIDGLNGLIRAMNKISFTAPDWVPVIGGKSFGINIPLISRLNIPKLAQGAVIPPNREFMAVLGDQKSGTNIEAPAALIKQMVMEAMREIGMNGGGGGDTTVILQIDGEEFGRFVHKYGNRESSRVGVSLVEG